MSEGDVEWDFDDWPDVAPTEILPGLWMGGLGDEEYLGCPLGDGHYSFDSPFDAVITLFGDAQPSPWGAVELRFGFPDDDLEPTWARTCLSLAAFGHAHWSVGWRVLVRCQQGVNRSGLVTALILMLDGHKAQDAIALLRSLRGPAVLNNTSFEQWLLDGAVPYPIERSTGAPTA